MLCSTMKHKAEHKLKMILKNQRHRPKLCPTLEHKLEHKPILCPTQGHKVEHKRKIRKILCPTLKHKTPPEHCLMRILDLIKKKKMSLYLYIQDIYKDKGGSGGKKKTGKPPPPKMEFDLSFIDEPTWENLVRVWLDYKRSRGENYKSELSVKKFHTMLRNLSRGDPNTASRIIDKSIANNWAGIFELIDAAVKPGGSPAVGQRIGQIKQPADEARRQKLLDKFGGKK